MPKSDVLKHNLLTGPCRVGYAPMSVIAPGKLQDLHALIKPYAWATGWIGFGGTNDAPSYERDMDSEQLYIDQETTAVSERITEVTRTLTLSLGEHRPDIAQIVEEAPSITSVASAANAPSQKVVDAGVIQTATRRRLVIIGERDPNWGAKATVKKAGEADRGTFAAIVFLAGAISADGSEIQIENDELAGREVQFTAYPDPTVVDALGNQVSVRHIFEDGGVLDAAGVFTVAA
jgi:hypothetical protein